MSVSGIESVGGFTPWVTPTVATPSVTAPTGTPEVQGSSFSDLLVGSIDKLEGMHDSTDSLAVQAATGDLNALHDYTIAATETSVATQLTVAVRNKAVEAFTEIMRMQV